MSIIAGNFLTFESGGGIDGTKNPQVLMNNRVVAGPWENINVINNPDGSISFALGPYFLTAEGGGGSVLSTNRTQAAAWESFKIVNGLIQCADGKSYLTRRTDLSIGANGTSANGIPFRILGHAPISRSKIINVVSNFCNIFDSDGWPIFDPFVDHLIITGAAKANDWAARLKDAGTIHWDIDLSGDYAENLGWAPRYPIPGSDWTNDLGNFKIILDWILNQGFIPHIHLAADGNTPDPVGMTYGWQWGMNSLPGILNQLKDYWNICLWNAGWDGCFPGWTLQQTQQFYTMLRNVLGSEAVLAAELGGFYCHFGGGGSDWYLPGIAEIEVLLLETAWDPRGPQNNEGLLEVAQRMLNVPPNSDYYLTQPRARSLTTVMYETCAYWITRKQFTSTQAVTFANQCVPFGYKQFGNGLPA